MENIILGLLLLCNRTIYQLRDRIDKGLSLMYSSSMGSIQAAIRKLLHCRYIGYEETVESGKYKKIYHITQSGRQAFFAWVNMPMEPQSVRCPELVKVYFMGLADPENREASIQSYVSFLKERHRALAMICEEANEAEVTESGKEIFWFQLASARYGRDLYQFNIDWFEMLLDHMRSGEI